MQFTKYFGIKDILSISYTLSYSHLKEKKKKEEKEMQGDREEM